MAVGMTGGWAPSGEGKRVPSLRKPPDCGLVLVQMLSCGPTGSLAPRRLAPRPCGSKLGLKFLCGDGSSGLQGIAFHCTSPEWRGAPEDEICSLTPWDWHLPVERRGRG